MSFSIENAFVNGITRGSTIISHFAHHSSKHPHLRIRRVQSCPGHLAIQFDESRMVLVLDNVPESIISSNINETISLQLLSTLLSTSSSSSLTGASSTTPRDSSSSGSGSSGKRNDKMDTSTGSRLGDNISLNNFKMGFNRLFQKASNNNTSGNTQNTTTTTQDAFIEQIQNQTTNVSSENDQQPVTILSEAGVQSILCFGDVKAPFVSVFFNYQKLDVNSQNVDIKLCAVQRNGYLSYWSFDEIRYTWMKGTFKKISDKPIAHATFIASLQRLVFTVLNEDILYSFNFVTNAVQRITEYDYPIREIKEGKNGIWIISNHKIEHVSIDGDHCYTTCSIPMTGITFTIDSISKAESMSDIVLHEPYYITYNIVPKSRELILFDLNGQIQLWSPSSMHPRTLQKSLTQSMEGKVSLYKKVLEQSSNKQTTIMNMKKLVAQCRQSSCIEIFLIHSTMLAVTDQEVVLIYEPKTCVKVGQFQLPNEIALESEKGFNRTILWNSYGSASRCGIFSSSGLFVIKCPPITEQLKQAMSQSSSQTNAQSIRDYNLYHYSAIAKSWGLQGTYLKILLELIMYDAEQAQKRKHLHSSKDAVRYVDDIETKRTMLDELVKHLENPALVWTACKNLSEHKHILKQVAQFVMHFPAPDSPFWKTEKQMQLSSTLKKKLKQASIAESEYWDHFLSSVAEKQRSDIPAQDIFEKMTPLNLSLVPTLAKSLSLDKELIDIFDEQVVSQTDSTIETVPETNLSNITQLTDIELEDISRDRPVEVLKGLCEYCGLSSFISVLDNTAEQTTSDIKNIILGYSIPDHTNLNRVLWDGIELTQDELLSHFDSHSMDHLITPGMVNTFSEDPDQFRITNGSLYLELIMRLLYDSTEHPQLILVLIVMLERYKVSQIKSELVIEEDKLKKINTNDLQLRKHQTQQHKSRIKDLSRLLEFNYKKYFAIRALDAVNGVQVTSDLTSFESNRKSDIQSPEQIQVETQLLLWKGQILEAIQLQLSKKMEKETLQILTEYVVDRGAKDAEIEYQNIKLAHEEQCELVHMLTQYCVENNISTSDTSNELWSFVWDLMPLGYNVFHFFNEFKEYSTSIPETMNHHHVDNNEEEDLFLNGTAQEQQPPKRPNIFATREDESKLVGNMENLVTSLRKKFAVSQKKLF
jgi:hypothetical protein